MRNTFTLLIGLLALGAFSQSYNFKNYNLEQGLPQSQVLSVFQDSRGYMWFGTNSGGVARFDGNKFTTLTANDGLVDNVVFSITELNNQLFFGTSKGLSIYNGLQIKNIGPKDGLKNAFIYKLVKDDNSVWIGTQEGVFIYNHDKISAFSGDSVLNKSSVYNILLDQDKNLWFGTLQNGLIFYNAKTKEFKHFNTSNKSVGADLIFSLGQKGNGEILVGTQYGLYTIDKQLQAKPSTEIPINNNISVASMVSYPGGIYLGTHSYGLADISFTDNKVNKNYNLANGLTNNAILSLFIDAEGNLWAGTDGAGVFKFYNNKFVFYNKANGFTDNYVNSVNADENNSLWVGLRKNGLVKITGRETKSYSFNAKTPGSLIDNDVNAILPLGNGRVMFGTSDGLCVFENEKFKVIGDASFRHKYIMSLLKDSKGIVWIGTTDGVYKLNGEEIAEEVSLNKFKEKDRQFIALFIAEDKQKNIWVGTETGLIFIENNKAFLFNKKDGLVDGRVNSGVVDSNNGLWIGTEEGLFHQQKGKFRKISGKTGLLPAYINLLTIVNNKLLMGTNNGIDVLDIKEFYSNNLSIKHFGKDDGLVSLESNFNACAIDRNGKVLIGTVNGLEIYDPALDIFNTKEARTNITSVKLFFGQEDVLKYAKGINSLTQLPDNLVLPYSKNNLTFNFVGISLIAPEKVLYQYKLEGLDEDWAPATAKTEATYPSLPPGKYKFVVKASNNDGLWNKEASVFEFEILPPWYNTWWFYVTCVIIVITGIVCYNYFKTKKLKADKQKLEREVNERTKELREEKEKVEVINKEVIKQKAEIEHKNTEITDSIKYAKNIQEALLPSIAETENAFDNCFILYLPKDIVSGDFLWFYQDGDSRYIAAADCTGHGVPGAFMSIVGNTLLNEIVKQKKITAPGDILLELHKGVKVALHQNEKESERRDGMDIALCEIKVNSSTIQYSGANRPLWIYRKNNNYELDVIKPNKFPIGGLEFEENRTYQNHSVDVFKGDCVYLFSDGYADQFGGPKGKKFMVANMQKLLFEIVELPMAEQKKKIHSAFSSWKQNHEQVDDILVIGIKI